MSDMNEAMANYFGQVDKGFKTEMSIPTPDIQSEGTYTYQPEKDGVPPNSTDGHALADRRILMADGNIDDVDAMAEEIRKLCNAAWGSQWGEFRSAFSTADDLEKSEGQIVTYDLLIRSTAAGTSLKPKFMYNIKEMVNNQPTGDFLRVSIMQFDTVVEFNVWGENDLDARKLSRKFETLLSTFAWRLKKVGVADMVFYREQPASTSDKFFPNKPMRSLLYKVKLDRYYVMRQSMLKQIELDLETIDQRERANTAPIG